VTRVLVDVNDRVRKGQVLVELDTSKFADQVARSRAAVASATAKVAQAVATVKEAESNLARNKEVARLSGGKVPSKSELDAAQAAFERAQADEAAARASVVDAKAALSTDETNLSKASIRSPIDGVVLTRSVDPGNAVAASLQAVTLFTIAEDLTKMRLQVNVDEADVGMVKVGQSASFTVSAYPTRRYPAKITRVAFGSTITDNVVTYITYLEVENSDLSLRPGMTATATIKATERRDVLLVPNTALRYTPTATGAGAAAAKGGGFVSSLVPRRPPRAPKTATAAPGSAAARRVWVLRDGAPVAVAIKPGVSDGRMTEVVSGELQPGMQVIVDQRAAAGS
jgi:HlyD family secretion protein